MTTTQTKQTDDELSHQDNSRSLRVPFQYSPTFPEILRHLNASLVVSTYQAGKVLVIGVHENPLQIF